MVKKRKLIFNIAMLSVAIAVILIIGIRYIIAPNNLPSMFVTLEMVSWLMAALIVLWLFRLNAVSEAKFQEAHRWAMTQKSFFEARQLELEQKIKELEGIDEQQINFHKKELLQKFQKRINNQTFKQFQDSLLPACAAIFEITTAILYWYNTENKQYEAIGNYALGKETSINPFKSGEGFCGQAASENKIISLTNIPEGYLETQSGLGINQPNHLYFLPITIKGNCIALFEIASFKVLEPELIWKEINDNIESIVKSLQ